MSLEGRVERQGSVWVIGEREISEGGRRAAAMVLKTTTERGPRRGSRRVEVCDTESKTRQSPLLKPFFTQIAATHLFENTTLSFTTPMQSYWVVLATSSFANDDASFFFLLLIFFPPNGARFLLNGMVALVSAKEEEGCWGWDIFTGEDDVAGSRSEE